MDEGMRSLSSSQIPLYSPGAVSFLVFHFIQCDLWCIFTPTRVREREWKQFLNFLVTYSSEFMQRLSFAVRVRSLTAERNGGRDEEWDSSWAHGQGKRERERRKNKVLSQLAIQGSDVSNWITDAIAVSLCAFYSPLRLWFFFPPLAAGVTS